MFKAVFWGMDEQCKEITAFMAYLNRVQEQQAETMNSLVGALTQYLRNNNKFEQCLINASPQQQRNINSTIIAGEPQGGSCLFFIIARRQNLSDVRLKTCAVNCVFYIRAFRGACDFDRLSRSARNQGHDKCMSLIACGSIHEGHEWFSDDSRERQNYFHLEKTATCSFLVSGTKERNL